MSTPGPSRCSRRAGWCRRYGCGDPPARAICDRRGIISGYPGCTPSPFCYLREPLTGPSRHTEVTSPALADSVASVGLVVLEVVPGVAESIEAGGPECGCGAGPK